MSRPNIGRLRLNCDDTRAENRFRLSAKRPSPFKSAGGVQFSQLAGELCASAYRVCTARVSLCSAVMWRWLVTHSILLFPLHFSSRASPCAITFQLVSTTTDAHTSAARSRLNWRPPADLNGLVRFAERRSLVSARVSTHFKRSLTWRLVKLGPIYLTQNYKSEVLLEFLNRTICDFEISGMTCWKAGSYLPAGFWWGWAGGWWWGRPGRQSPRGRNMKDLNTEIRFKYRNKI